jgi:type IV secretory pathway VirB2 component (pilin)
MPINNFHQERTSSLIPALLVLGIFMALPQAAFASDFNLPIISTIGCKIVSWMQGPLSIVIFLLVAVSTIVIGMFAKMDWSKILSIVVLYGILQGLFSIVSSMGAIPLPSGCLIGA